MAELIATKLGLILTEKTLIKEVVNTFLGKTLDLKSGVDKPAALGDVFSGYSEKIDAIFTVLNDSIAEKKTWLTGIKSAVNGVYAGTLDDAFADYDTKLSAKLTALKARENALDAAKTSLVNATKAAADLTEIAEPADAAFAGAITSAIEAIQTIATTRKDQLTATADEVDRYSTQKGAAAPVAGDFTKLEAATKAIVDALIAADEKDDSLTSTLESIATNHNLMVDGGIEEIPAALKGEGDGKFADTAEGLATYKESLKLKLPAEGEDPATVYATWPAKMITAGAVEASEIKIVASIVAAVNTADYGVTVANKLPAAEADYLQIPGKVVAALDDILAKGVSNNNQALKTAVKDDKQVNGSAVIEASNTSEAGYINLVHTALAGWQTEADAFKTAVNAKIALVNAQVATEANHAAAIADNATPDTYDTAVVTALDKYQTEIVALNGKFDDATAFKNNIRGQVNGELATGSKLAGDASYTDIQDGLSGLLSNYNKELNKILWGTETEGSL